MNKSIRSFKVIAWVAIKYIRAIFRILTLLTVDIITCTIGDKFHRWTDLTDGWSGLWIEFQNNQHDLIPLLKTYLIIGQNMKISWVFLLSHAFVREVEYKIGTFKSDDKVSNVSHKSLVHKGNNLKVHEAKPFEYP